MDDLITAYALDQQRRGLSPLTVDKRTRTLRLVTRSPHFQGDRGSIEAFLDPDRLSAKTRAVYVSHLRSFYKWATEMDLLDDDPTAKIKAPKVGKRLPRPMTKRELNKLATDNPRLRAMILCGTLAGLRCMEIAGLDGQDVSDSLRVLGKGDKERSVPLHPELERALKTYGLPDIGPVFPNASGQPVTPDAISHELGYFIHRREVAGGAHRLRHTFATALYRSTLDVILVRDILGHSDVSSTMVYASADMEKARGVIYKLRAA